MKNRTINVQIPEQDFEALNMQLKKHRQEYEYYLSKTDFVTYAIRFFTKYNEYLELDVMDGFKIVHKRKEFNKIMAEKIKQYNKATGLQKSFFYMHECKKNE